jgi:hypothetical protein
VQLGGGGDDDGDDDDTGDDVKVANEFTSSKIS